MQYMVCGLPFGRCALWLGVGYSAFSSMVSRFLNLGSSFFQGEGAMGLCLLSSFPLFSMRYVRCLMVFWCMHFIMFFMLFFGMLRYLGCDIWCSWIAPQTSTIMVRRGFTFHPLLSSAPMNGLYFGACFPSMIM